LVVPAGIASTIRVDGQPVDQSLFRTIAGSSWKSAQLQVLKGTHTVRGSQAFGLEVYGVGFYDSYAYTGGQSTADVSSVATLSLSSNSVSGVVGQQLCVPVTVLDTFGAPVPGIRVDADITGVSGTVLTNGTSDTSGVANICYTGSAVGSDSLLISANGLTQSVSVTWTLTAPNISYNPSAISIGTSVSMPTLTPANTGGLASSWSVSPALPTGLSLSATTGVISGTPSSATSAANYTITATNSGGSSSSILSIAVETPVVPSISYSASSFVLNLDSVTATITPTVTGTFPTWSISPRLPSGLSFNLQSGEITGTPTAVSSSTTYTVTATNSAGSVSTTVGLSVVPTPPDITYSPTSFTGYQNFTFTTVNPRNAGSPATSWSITPTLPAGLSFNSTSGAISGNPSATSDLASYTIT
jgi:hypothetical protein